MATTASGVTIPGASPTTTAATPIQDHWNNLGTSLNGRIVVPVASVTARAALVSALTAEGYTISSSNPLIVWRADAIPGSQTEVTTNGSTFTPIGGAGANMGTPVSAAAVGTTTSGTTETRDAVLGNYTFTAVAGRRYQVVVNGMLGSGSVVGDLFAIKVRNGGASTPTTASTAVASLRYPVFAAGGVGQTGIPLSGTFVPGAGTVTLGIFAVRLAGTGILNLASDAVSRELYAVDIGPA